MATAGIEIFVKIDDLIPEMAGNVAQALSAQVTRRARQKVAVSTEITRPGGPHGVLRNTIQTIGVSRTEFITVAETEYAAAQEWGRPDLNNYTYTPYMGPAAEEVSSPTVFVPIANLAMAGAIRKNRVRASRG